MDNYQFISLLLIAVVFVISPGPGTLAVFSKSLSQGFASAFYLSFGMVLSDLVYLIAVIYSLDVFAEAIIPIMDIVKVLGGVYLIYLGFNTWHANKIEPNQHLPNQANTKELSTGFLIGITNPKVMVFYIAVLPAFMDLSQVNMTHGAQILATVGLGLLLGISVFNFAASKLRQLFDSHGSMGRRIHQISGSIMMLVGVLLALS